MPVVSRNNASSREFSVRRRSEKKTYPLVQATEKMGLDQCHQDELGSGKGFEVLLYNLDSFLVRVLGFAVDDAA